jgi:hypothetical protein
MTVENAGEYILTRMMPQLKRLGYSNYTLIKKQTTKKQGPADYTTEKDWKGLISDSHSCRNMKEKVMPSKLPAG